MPHTVARNHRATVSVAIGEPSHCERRGRARGREHGTSFKPVSFWPITGLTANHAVRLLYGECIQRRILTVVHVVFDRRRHPTSRRCLGAGVSSTLRGRINNKILCGVGVVADLILKGM